MTIAEPLTPGPSPRITEARGDEYLFFRVLGRAYDFSKLAVERFFAIQTNVGQFPKIVGPTPTPALSVNSDSVFPVLIELCCGKHCSRRPASGAV